MINTFTLQQVLPTSCWIGGEVPHSTLVTICPRPAGVYKYMLQGFILDNINNKYKAFKVINFN